MVATEALKGFAGQEDPRERLAKHGLMAEDINFAIILALWIKFFDSLLFYRKHTIVFLPRPSRERILAYWDRGVKCYTIVVPGISKRLKEEWRRQIIHLTRSGIMSYPLSRANQRKLVTWRDVMVSVAAHEARHCVQETPGFGIFTYENPQLPESAWQIYGKLRKKEHITVADMLMMELSAERERGKIAPDELDAKVVEGVAINMSHAGRPIAEIVAVVKMQATA